MAPVDRSRLCISKVRTKDGGMYIVIYLSVTEKGVDSRGVKKGMCAISVHHSDLSTSQKVDERKPGEQSTKQQVSLADIKSKRKWSKHTIIYDTILVK